MDGPSQFSRYDLDKRRQERESMLRKFRQYIDDNNPPILGDLKTQMEPLLSWGYASLPDLLTIVNAKISPLKIIDTHDNKFISKANYLDDLRMIDSRDSSAAAVTQNFHGPVGTVGHNAGTSSALHISHQSKKTTIRFWEKPLFIALLSIPLGLVVVFLAYKFGWQ
jgi:hypothetical protein